MTRLLAILLLFCCIVARGQESAYSTEVDYTVPCTNCPYIETNYVETNYVFAYGHQLCVQTDVVYWPFLSGWTNSFPGYQVSACFRLLSTSNYMWQVQASANLQAP